MVAAFGLGQEDGAASYPGPVNAVIYAIVPFVWISLFAAMAAAAVILWRHGESGRLGAVATTVLFGNCALYPAYTLGFSSRELGLAGNVLTAILAAFAMGAAANVSRPAMGLIAPVLVWVCLASVGLVAVMTGGTF